MTKAPRATQDGEVRRRQSRPSTTSGSRRTAVTMADVAREAGVGTMTVSRALRNNGRVSEQARRRVEKAVRKLHYVPNVAAGTLRSNRSHIIAVIVPTISHSIFADTLQAMSEVFHPAGFHLLIGQTAYSLIEEEALIRAFLSRQPEAFVLTGYTHTRGSKQLLKRAGFPVVEIWNTCERPLDMMVGVSNFDAARDMTRLLIRRGHKIIGYIGGLREGNDRTERREAGYRVALEEAGLPFDATLIERAPFEHERGGEALNQLLIRRPDMTCVFAASDILAVGALLEANNRGISVPRRLAIAGFDDIGLAERVSPPLTTVRFPRTAIGRTTAEIILRRLTDGTSPNCVVDLGYELIERRST